MKDNTHTQTVETRAIDGVDALINTNPGDIFIDLPASNPRYIRLQEGDRIQEGDVSTRTAAEMAGPLLAHWTIDTITTETVRGTNTQNGKEREWDRENLIARLCAGEFSAELRTFDRVSITEIEEWPGLQHDRESDTTQPYIVAVIYGNNGDKFTQVYAATAKGEWDSLQLVQQDTAITDLSDSLQQTIEAAVQTALATEKQYQRFDSLE